MVGAATHRIAQTAVDGHRTMHADGFRKRKAPMADPKNNDTAPQRISVRPFRGRIRMAPDFDTLPPDVLAAMYGEEL
jgi:hypothetical protein